MRRKRTTPDPEKMAAFLSRVRQERSEKAGTYREQALKLFPHVCGRCGRDFAGKNLRELTVHHKDHNHHNNPADGSNWELLCLYCHDDEHLDPEARETTGNTGLGVTGRATLGVEAFEGLKDLLKDTEKE